MDDLIFYRLIGVAADRTTLSDKVSDVFKPDNDIFVIFQAFTGSDTINGQSSDRTSSNAMVATDADSLSSFNTGGTIAGRWALQDMAWTNKRTLPALNTLIQVKRDFWHTEICRRRNKAVL